MHYVHMYTYMYVLQYTAKIDFLNSAYDAGLRLILSFFLFFDKYITAVLRL